MPTDLTGLLQAASAGDRAAFDHAFELLYTELTAMARSQRRRWVGNQTLDTSALVHEAYLKLMKPGSSGWQGSGHFLAVAARAMRHVLVNYAEARRAMKRGGDASPLSLDALGPFEAVDEGANPVAPEAAEELLALHGALRRLEVLDQRQGRVVECRFFAGLSVPETAAALGVSVATVKRDWQLASAWLHRELHDGLAAGRGLT